MKCEMRDARCGLTFRSEPARAFAPRSGHRGIRWVLCHLGGAIPYLAERLDRGYFAFSECREHIGRPPSEILKRFYYDTVNFDPNCLRLAIEFAGADHLLAGSDYPHLIGSLDKMTSSLRKLEISEEQRNGILGGNAARLLGIAPD